MSRLSNRSFVFLALVAVLVDTASAQSKAGAFRAEVPKTWDETALANWATPLAGLNARPTYISAEQYYSLPIDNFRTYPAYAAGHKPSGYWEMSQTVGPKPLIRQRR